MTVSKNDNYLDTMLNLGDESLEVCSFLDVKESNIGNIYYKQHRLFTKILNNEDLSPENRKKILERLLIIELEAEHKFGDQVITEDPEGTLIEKVGLNQGDRFLVSGITPEKMVKNEIYYLNIRQISGLAQFIELEESKRPLGNRYKFINLAKGESIKVDRESLIKDPGKYGSLSGILRVLRPHALDSVLTPIK